MEPGGRHPEDRDGFCLTFLGFLKAGTIPPYSKFLISFLQYYGIRLAYLTQNSICHLSTFAYLCEQFLGVTPCLELFRSLYFLRDAGGNATIGRSYLQLRDSTQYILLKMRNNWRNWRDQWLYVAYTRNGLEEFDLPTAAPVSHGISEATPNTDLVKNLKGRIMSRKAMGLTRAMVTRDAVRRRISPLRNRPRLACNYYGDNDVARTFPSGKFLFFVYSPFYQTRLSPLTSIVYAQWRATLAPSGSRASWRS